MTPDEAITLVREKIPDALDVCVEREWYGHSESRSWRICVRVPRRGRTGEKKKTGMRQMRGYGADDLTKAVDYVLKEYAHYTQGKHYFPWMEKANGAEEANEKEEHVGCDEREAGQEPLPLV